MPDPQGNAPPAESPVERHSSGAPLLPDRYRVQETEEGRFLVCEEAPRIRVDLAPSNTYDEAEARELGPRVILLDGAGSFGPLLDPANHFYNLDHHAGCERAFTLASCEQALLLVGSGPGLDEGDWTIYANEPDLDTTLALWCLLNFQRIPGLDGAALDVLHPLIRLEGAIDANGTELALACGLPAAVLRETRSRLDGLLAAESERKAAGTWHQDDWLEFALGRLAAIDALIYRPSDFREYATVEEIYDHCEIGERRVAVACRDRGGIYEVEQKLKARWGDQLCVVALEKEPGHFTLRRAAVLSGIDLEPAYEMLNRIDPSVDGRPAGKRWGGSDAIGGSPRPGGTQLGPAQILRGLQATYTPVGRRKRLKTLASSAALSLALVFVATLASLAWNVLPGSVPRALAESARLATFAALVLAASLVATQSLSGGRFWLYGWRRPAGRDWCWLLPVPLLAAVPNRAWIPQEVGPGAGEFGIAVAVSGLAALACEAWFRGWVHGRALLTAPVERVGGPWFLSEANWGAALVYATICVLGSLFWVLGEPTALLSPFEEFTLIFGASLLGGLALGIVRERSLSLWPGVALQWLAGLGALLYAPLLRASLTGLG
ncbi:MAG: hypothetical protein VCC02_10730 [Myxococcota bacterium]